ncbi:HlyD family secretion protein [Acetobacter sp.]|jgi:membrane fusion protein (multidrug efflux system)|uniref:HlyD family secretion protein n=1 Tax=Acetobacter sp. TaxID=440 RepID=UPI0025C53D2F|nr:HlyD family secretion protein [Acetobacter sp.]MCH4092496.1 HlyD family secretion protein [Acetobacter sp.]MCI1299630.1 HlyD family secretion protein [Acetobacter sp.]MCI1315490.1 HlyD family secretion protein [Acetobacter sp.]
MTQADKIQEEGGALYSMDALATEGDADKKLQKKNWRLNAVLIVFLVILTVFLLYHYFYKSRNDVTTEDAYTAGRKHAISSQVSGYVTQLLVDDNQFVYRGDLLLSVDHSDYVVAFNKARASVLKAEANIKAFRMIAEISHKTFPGRLRVAEGSLQIAEAQLMRAKADYRRQLTVMREGTSQQDIDHARTALEEAQARVASAQGDVTQAEPVESNLENAAAHVSQEEAALVEAKADLEQAEINLARTHIRAPCDGWVSQRNVEVGNFVKPGQQMMSIVPSEVWIVANYKETQIQGMKPGQKVDISINAFPELRLQGHVDSIQLGSGESFSTFPPENATGNFVKIVQRIPVKIRIDTGLPLNSRPLPLGLSVEPVVHIE